jgi:hypothetical protein
MIPPESFYRKLLVIFTTGSWVPTLAAPRVARGESTHDKGRQTGTTHTVPVPAKAVAS